MAETRQERRRHALFRADQILPNPSAACVKMEEITSQTFEKAAFLPGVGLPFRASLCSIGPDRELLWLHSPQPERASRTGFRFKTGTWRGTPTIQSQACRRRISRTC